MNEDYEKYFKGDEELEVINIKWFIYLINSDFNIDFKDI